MGCNLLKDKASPTNLWEALSEEVLQLCSISEA
jgi:hypothetical protein